VALGRGTAWPPYDLYNLDPAHAEEIIADYLEPRNALVGFCCFGPDARVPGGAYDDDLLDIGMGVRPDLTGHGHGHRYARAVLDFAARTYAPNGYRVTITAFNHRARRVWEKMGFQESQRFCGGRDNHPFVVMVATEV
jgi:RimJ/RimL family protein N-acetyltransferase